MSSRQLDEIYDKQSDEFIANLLGISTDDYLSLNHNGIQEVSSNDGFIYQYYIQFSDDSPREILDKIEGLDSTNTVYFEASLFND